jgi:ERCC4-type nuclease
MKKRRFLIPPPLDWQAIARPVPHPVVPVIAERGGAQLRTPRPVAVVDSREKNPFDLRRFDDWFADVERRPLEVGDYAVAAMEHLCVVERKDLPHLIRSFTGECAVFVRRLQRMSRYEYRLLAISASLSGLKSPYRDSGANPNRLIQSLIALLAGLQVPFICADTHELGEVMVASYLYQVHRYHWLDTEGHGRFLTDDDL